MFLNGFPGRIGPGIPGPEVTYFDFAVAERPSYTPGSGPPLAPITPMPIHDKDGVILDLIQLGERDHRYVVGFADKPSLFVSVKLENILNWVSPRTFENWQYERTIEQDDILEEARMPRLKGKEEKKKKSKRAKLVGNGSREETKTEQELKATTGKRKRAMFAKPDVGKPHKETRIIPGMGLGMVTVAPSGPGRRRKSIAEETPLFTSPKASQKSSQSSPNKQRGLAYLAPLESDEEDEDVELALEMQLNARFAPRPIGGRSSQSRSTSTSREPSYDSDQPAITFTKPTLNLPPSRLRESSRPTSSSSRSTRSASASAAGNESRKQRQSSLGGTQATATTSSREAAAMYEEIERKNKAKFIRPGQTISQTYSYKPRKVATPAVDNDDDKEDKEEYAVDCILGHEKRRSEDGKWVTYYLIKWIGEWENTWEPEDFVSHGAINDYKNKKKQEKKKRRKLPKEDAGDELLELGRGGKVLKQKDLKKQRPIEINSDGDRDGDDVDMLEATNDAVASSDEDELFVSENPKPRFPNERGDTLKSKGKEVVPARARGVVIDDDDESD